jgi:hypothetical protein
MRQLAACRTDCPGGLKFHRGSQVQAARRMATCDVSAK